MSEYSPLPGTVRSYDERAEFDEPCTRNRTGSAVSPGVGAPMRLRQRLSATSPFLAQYSALQIAPSLGCALPAPVVCACAGKGDTSPAPRPRLAPFRMVRRASGCAGGSGLSVMASSDFGASWRRRRVLERFSHELIRAARRPADGPSRHADLRAKLSQRKLSPLPPRF